MQQSIVFMTKCHANNSQQMQLSPKQQTVHKQATVIKRLATFSELSVQYN